ncbi:MAG: hypothetical protein K8R21_05105 [Leptospira sp.]|nr:hypothetical protein [Leptospira sp.]
MADLIDLETLPQLSRNDLMRAGNMIYRLLQNSGTDFDRELDKYSRKKAYRILIQEYGKIVQRELQKKESTLNSVVAEGIPYSEFLYNEMSFVQNIVTEIKPGPSLIEEIYLAEVNDGKFEDYTSKNLLLSIRYRLMAILEPEKREYLEKGYTHLSKIKWQDHNFTLRENFFRQKFLDAIRNELPGETDFYSRVAGILEKQSLEVVKTCCKRRG